MKPILVYYAVMVDCTKGKTPKYRVEKEALSYPPMKDLIGKDGFVSMYFKPNVSSKPDAPEMNLQAKDSLNFTGLKFFKADGAMNEWAYGNPMQSPSYSKDNKPNPFYKYRHSCYVFRMHYKGSNRPSAIELFVLAGDEWDRLEQMAPSYCKQFSMGCYNEEIAALRKQANAQDDLFDM